MMSVGEWMNESGFSGAEGGAKDDESKGVEVEDGRGLFMTSDYEEERTIRG